MAGSRRSHSKITQEDKWVTRNKVERMSKELKEKARMSQAPWLFMIARSSQQPFSGASLKQSVKRIEEQMRDLS